MVRKNLAVVAVALLFSFVPSWGQEVTPRLNLAGRGIVSFNGRRLAFPAGGTDFSSLNDFSDSALLLRLDQQLYSGNRAGVVLGFQFPDVDSDLGQVFFHQVNVFYSSKNLDVRLGRSRLRSQLIEFPTLRDDDLVEFTYVANAFSNSENSEFQQFGNVFSIDFYQYNAKLVASAFAENLAKTDLSGKRLNEFEVNAWGASLLYRLPFGIRFAGVVQQAGVTFRSQFVDLPGRNWISSATAGLVLNLNRNPINHVELRAQTIYNFGMKGAGIGSLVARARERSWTAVGALRFLRNPYQVPRLQAAVTFAFQRFPEMEASQLSVVPNIFYRVGANVDVGLQYQFSRRSDLLAVAIGSKTEQTLKATLVYSFDLRFNDYFGDRDSILNMEHGYIP